MTEQDKSESYKGVSSSLMLRQPSNLLSAPYEVVGAEDTLDLVAYWRVFRKRRWTILTILFVLFTIVLLGTLKQTPTYISKVLIEISKENPDILTAQELFELDAVSNVYLETQYKVLESEGLARRVIEQLRLGELEEFNPSPAWWSFRKKKKVASSDSQVFAVGDAAFGLDAREYQAVLARFNDRLDVSPVKRSRLVEISFESESPVLAAQVVNALGSNYIEQNLEARWEATQKATEWISQQLGSVKVRLEKSEEELQQYARARGLLFLGTAAGNSENIVDQRLRQLQEELTKAQAARYEKEALYRLVEAGNYGSLPGVFENKLIQDLTLASEKLKSDLAELNTTFTADFPMVKKVQSQVREAESALAQERERAAQRITNDYQAAVGRENLLQRAFEAQEEQANLIAERSVQYNILKREVDTNKQLYEGLLQRMKEAGVSAGLKSSNIRIVDAAEPSVKPAKPNLLLNLALAFVLGLGLGCGVAFLQEYLDNTLKTSEDVERFLRVPTLALIPAVESLNGHSRGVNGHAGLSQAKLLASDGASDSAEGELPAVPQMKWFRIDRDNEQAVLEEAIRNLRTSVLLSTAGHPPRSLLVSSAQPGEGKTTIAINLAISLVQLGERVLLIDCDMRRPSVHKAFEITGGGGMARYLTGQQDWREVVQPAGLMGLDVIVCGPVPPNPAELLSSGRMQKLIGEAMADYKFVVFDSPPILSVADSRILATLAEGVVFVVKGGTTSRELIQRARFHIRDVGANIIGVVLNQLDARADEYYYGSYHGYVYHAGGEDTADKTS